MTDEIPPLLPPHLMPPVSSVSDLDRFWRSLKGPWGFAQPQLWCVVLGPRGEWTSIFLKIEQCPDEPDVTLVERLFGVVADVVDDHVPGGSMALMFARPGGDELSDVDRRWARQLTSSGHASRIDAWPVFLANDERARIAAPDDLAA